MPQRTYVFVDTAQVQEYILGPKHLRMNRGASKILRHLTEKHLPDFATSLHGQTVFANGGNLLAAFPSTHNAESFLHEVHDAFRRHTIVARPNCVTHTAGDSDFPATFDALHEKLARAKAFSPSAVFNGDSSFWAACSACGQYPATDYVIGDEAENAVLIGKSDAFCLACIRRHEQGIQQGPADFQQIAEASSPQNYLALLYIDLDQMGHFFKTHARPSEEQCRTVATAVDQAIQGALRFASNSINRPHEKLLSGGDDAAIILPASDGLPYLSDFRRHLDDNWPLPIPRPTFSAALVIAHSHFPIHAFFDVAKKLLRSAKLRRESDSVDWELITNANAEQDPVEVRRSLATFGLLRTAKPYSWDEFNHLTDCICRLKQEPIPSTKVHSLYRIAYQHRYQAEWEYFRLLTSLNGSRSRNLLVDLIENRTNSEKSTHNGNRPHSPFQILSSGDRGTRAADAVELWEFLQ